MENKLMDMFWESLQRIETRLSATDQRAQSVEHIVSNGLRERMVRIEQKLDEQDQKLDALLVEIHGLHRRVDTCVDKDTYESDRRQSWDGIDRRRHEDDRSRHEMRWRVVLIVIQLMTATLMGRIALYLWG